MIETIIATTTAIEFGKWIADKIGEKGFDKIYSKLTAIDKKNAFYKIVELTSNEIEEKYPHILGGSINYFFQKEEVFNELVNLLFIDSKVNNEVIEKQFDIETLPKDFISEFILLLKKKLLDSEDFRDILTSREVYVTCLGISSDINLIKNQTTLSLTELANVRNLLEDRFTKVFDESIFKENYLRNSLNNLSQVNFIGLGVDYEIKKGKRKIVSQIFVKPYFTISKESYNRFREDFLRLEIGHRIYYPSLFRIPKNIIILGNPGSGKSFIVKSIICSIINKSTSELRNQDIFNYLPFRIELRKYLVFKRENGGNILNYLLFLLSTEYSINTVLESTLDSIIREEKTLFFFDGLDEIFNPIEKNDIKNDIENFHGNYQNIKSITTSRIEGYEDAPFAKEQFCELTIETFNNEQIEEYLNLWYKAEDEDEEVINNEVKDFLAKKNNLDEELTKNPLLLSLIVILYRNNLKLPESKLEIYRSCTSTLVDKWDSTKDLSIDLENDILRRKEPILADLAYWQYSNLSDVKGKKITYERAKNLVAKVIFEKFKIGDEYTADSNAEKFMNYASKRSIYFENNFTHKTFLEYYTAYWIYTNIEKKHKEEERNRLITLYIGNPFWHIVIELLINLIDKDQADDEIIDEIFIEQLKKPENCINLFLSVLNSVQNISINIKDKLFYDSINYIFGSNLSENLDERIDKLIIQKGKTDFIKLSKYHFIDGYNDILSNAFKRINLLYISDESILTEFYIFYCESILEHRNSENSNIVIKNLFESEIFRLAQKNNTLFKLSNLVFKRNELSENWIEELKNYVELFDINTIYSDLSCLYTDTVFIPYFNILVRYITLPNYILQIENNLNELYKIGFTFEDLLVRFFCNYSYIFDSHIESLSQIEVLLKKEVSLKTEILLVSYLLALKKHFNTIRISLDFKSNINKMLSKDLETNKILEIVIEEYDLNKNKIEAVQSTITDIYPF